MRWGVRAFWSSGCCRPGGGSHGRPGTQGRRFISMQATLAGLGLAVLSSRLPAARPVGAASSEPSGKPPPNPLNQHNRVGGGPPEESAIRSHAGCACRAWHHAVAPGPRPLSSHREVIKPPWRSPVVSPEQAQSILRGHFAGPYSKPDVTRLQLACAGHAVEKPRRPGLTSQDCSREPQCPPRTGRRRETSNQGGRSHGLRGATRRSAEQRGRSCCRCQGPLRAQRKRGIGKGPSWPSAGEGRGLKPSSALNPCPLGRGRGQSRGAPVHSVERGQGVGTKGG